MRALQTATLATVADADALVSALDSSAGYPRKGVGGSLVQAEVWDGTGPCPPGWTATAAEVVVAKDGTAIVNAKARDVACLGAVALDIKATLGEKRIAATVFTAKSDVIAEAPVDALPVDVMPLAKGKP